MPLRALASSIPPPSANVTVFAEGLDNPRGLELDPDGLLYVAEGGQGGTTSTEGQCDQVVPPVGPYTGGDNARISALDADGQRTTVAEGLPSDQTPLRSVIWSPGSPISPSSTTRSTTSWRRAAARTATRTCRTGSSG